MIQQPSSILKVAYCLVLLAAILPFGLAKSGWVGLATGASMGLVPFLGPLVFLGLGLYRVYLVARVPGVLSSPEATGLAAFLRAAGTFCLYVGVLASVLSWVAGPLMRAFMKSRTDSGAEFFVVGVYLSLAAGIGMLGLLSFEFSRLLAFERDAQRASAKPLRQGDVHKRASPTCGRPLRRKLGVIGGFAALRRSPAILPA